MYCLSLPNITFLLEEYDSAFPGASMTSCESLNTRYLTYYSIEVITIRHDAHTCAWWCVVWYHDTNYRLCMGEERHTSPPLMVTKSPQSYA